MRVALGGHESEKAHSEISLKKNSFLQILASIGFNVALSIAASLFPTLVFLFVTRGIHKGSVCVDQQRVDLPYGESERVL